MPQHVHSSSPEDTQPKPEPTSQKPAGRNRSAVFPYLFANKRRTFHHRHSIPKPQHVVEPLETAFHLRDRYAWQTTTATAAIYPNRVQAMAAFNQSSRLEAVAWCQDGYMHIRLPAPLGDGAGATAAGSSNAYASAAGSGTISHSPESSDSNSSGSRGRERAAYMTLEEERARRRCRTGSIHVRFPMSRSPPREPMEEEEPIPAALDEDELIRSWEIAIIKLARHADHSCDPVQRRSRANICARLLQSAAQLWPNVGDEQVVSWIEWDVAKYRTTDKPGHPGDARGIPDLARVAGWCTETRFRAIQNLVTLCCQLPYAHPREPRDDRPRDPQTNEPIGPFPRGWIEQVRVPSEDRGPQVLAPPQNSRPATTVERGRPEPPPWVPPPPMPSTKGAPPAPPAMSPAMAQWRPIPVKAPPGAAPHPNPMPAPANTRVPAAYMPVQFNARDQPSAARVRPNPVHTAAVATCRATPSQHHSGRGQPMARHAVHSRRPGLASRVAIATSAGGQGPTTTAPAYAAECINVAEGTPDWRRAPSCSAGSPCTASTPSGTGTTTNWPPGVATPQLSRKPGSKRCTGERSQQPRSPGNGPAAAIHSGKARSSAESGRSTLSQAITCSPTTTSQGICSDSRSATSRL